MRTRLRSVVLLFIIIMFVVLLCRPHPSVLSIVLLFTLAAPTIAAAALSTATAASATSCFAFSIGSPASGGVAGTVGAPDAQEALRW